jgi:hypothetical protein
MPQPGQCQTSVDWLWVLEAGPSDCGRAKKSSMYPEVQVRRYMTPACTLAASAKPGRQKD